jgi:hypothetical protein
MSTSFSTSYPQVPATPRRASESGAGQRLGASRSAGRRNHRLATEIAAAVSRIANVAADRVLVMIQSSPARFAVEGGRVLPEPGQEQAWFAAE